MTLRVAGIAVMVGLASSMAGAAEVRFVGDALPLVANDVVPTADEGWFVAGKLPTPQWGIFDGFVMRGNRGDVASWALRIPGLPLEAVAILPDGGALVAGGSWTARLDPSGAVAWQSDWSGTAVHDIACNGWDCIAAGDGFVARLDGATGAASWTAKSAQGPEIVVTRLLWLSSGDVLLGGRMSDDEISTSVTALMDATGAIQWSRDLGTQSWDYDAAGITRSDTTALVETADGGLVVVAHDAFAEGRVVSMRPDGTPTARFVSSSYLPASLVATPAGALLLGCYPRRVEVLDAGLALDDAVDLGADNLPWSAPLLALSPGGDLIAVDHVGPEEVVDPRALVVRLSRMSSTLVPDGACPSLTASPLDLVAGSRPAPELAALAIDFPLRGGLAFVPANEIVQAACTLAPCLARGCESACSDGRDDDANGSTDCLDRACAFDPACGAADSDGDGVPNATDCRPDDARHAEPPGTADLRVTAWKGPGVAIPRIAWSSPGSRGDVVDIMRGELAVLRASRSLATGACVVQRWEWSMFQDHDASGHPESLWWIARARNACGVGSWGSVELDVLGGCP